MLDRPIQLLLRHSLHVDAGYEPVIDYGTGPFPGDGLPIELQPVSGASRATPESSRRAAL